MNFKILQVGLLLLTFTLSSCAIGKRGVSYSEMHEPPKLIKESERLIIETKNSAIHSAKFIYKIEVQIDQNKKEVLVSAKQALNKKSLSRYEIELNKNDLPNLNGWTVNWVDPDGNKTELKIENNLP